MADSLQLVPLLPANTKCAIDMGSGAGFPGLVLALATGIHFTLIEADRRKAAFLAEAGRVTAAPVAVIADRIEQCRLDPANLITARALAPLADLLDLSERLRKWDAVCLFPKSTPIEAELSACTSWTMTVQQYRSAVDPRGVVLRLSEVGRADQG